MHEANFHTKERKNLSILCFLRKEYRWLFRMYLFYHISSLHHRIRNIVKKGKNNICWVVQVHVYFFICWCFLLFHISRRKQLQIQQINFFHVLKKMTWSFLCIRTYTRTIFCFISINIYWYMLHTYMMTLKSSILNQSLLLKNLKEN